MKAKLRINVVLLAGICQLALGLPDRAWSESNMPWDCGPSTYFSDFKDTTPGAGTARGIILSTTNLTSIPFNPLATTSGTSGCRGWFGTASTLRMERYHFLTKVHKQLGDESARGEGPHLKGLAALMGCPSRQHSEFVNVIRRNHIDLFDYSSSESANPEKLLIRITDIINKNPLLSQSCSLNG